MAAARTGAASGRTKQEELQKQEEGSLNGIILWIIGYGS